MRIIRDTIQFDTGAPCAVAIGKFDGLHKGHRKLIGDLVNAKEAHGYEVAIFTFDPSPLLFFGNGTYRELTTIREKRAIFEALKVDILYEFPLNERTAAIDPEAFVREFLVGSMHAKIVSAGEDLSFGHRGIGNFALLERLGGELGFETHKIQKVLHDGKEISSTGVREAVEEADMELCETLLERPYSVCGKVMHGKKLGRTIGFPTINLIPPKEKLLPKNGVYFSNVRTGGQLYRAVTNIGVKPTVSDEKALTLEAHLYDFEGDLYDAFAEVELLRFHRPERKFGDIDALKKQIREDFDAGASYFALQ